MSDKLSSSRAADRAAVVRQKISDREAKLANLRSHYGRFGDRVLQAVFQAHEHEGGLRRLVHRVTGRVVIQEHAQHQVLLEFIHRHGEGVFLRQATGLAGSGDAVVSDPDAAVVLSTATAASCAPKGARIRLPTGEVIEDRRSGEERRKGKDRRSALDIIYKNKRYGGDRRRGAERRRSSAHRVD